MLVSPSNPFDQTLLAENKRRMLSRLKQQLQAYEQRYETPSAKIADELAAGHLQDTAEVCDWVIAFRTYQALISGQPARLE